MRGLVLIVACLCLLVSIYGAWQLYGAAMGSGQDVGWWLILTPLLLIASFALVIWSAVLSGKK